MKITTCVALVLVLALLGESCRKREEPQPPTPSMVIPPLDVILAKKADALTVSSQVFNSTNSPLRSHILKAAIDPQDRVWVCAKVEGSIDHPGRGLAYFDGTVWKTVTRQNYPNLPNDGAYDITFDKAGTPWYGTMAGLVKLDADAPKLIPIPLSNPAIANGIAYRVSITPSDRVWTAGIGSVSRYNGVGFETLRVSINEQESNLLTDKQNRLWVAGRSGLTQVSPDLKTTTYSALNAPLPANNVTDVTITPNDDVWFSVNSGSSTKLFRLRNGAFSALDLTNIVPVGPIEALSSDRLGRVWFTVGKTIYRADADGTVRQIQVPNLTGQVIDFTFDSKNRGWISAYTQLIRFTE